MNKEDKLRYLNHTIINTPTDTVPHMVTIIKGAKKYDLVERKYVSLNKAKIAVELATVDTRIKNGEKQAKKDMVNLGLKVEE
jgi:hypothetical protein